MISRAETAKAKKASTRANRKSRVALGDKSLRVAEKSAAERSLEEELFGNLQPPPAVNKGKGRAALDSELVEGAGDSNNITDEQVSRTILFPALRQNCAHVFACCSSLSLITHQLCFSPIMLRLMASQTKNLCQISSIVQSLPYGMIQQMPLYLCL